MQVKYANIKIIATTSRRHDDRGDDQMMADATVVPLRHKDREQLVDKPVIRQGLQW